MKTRKKYFSIICIFVAFLFLTLVINYSFANFLSIGHFKTSIRAAKWEIDAYSDDSLIYIYSGDSDSEYDFCVTSDSEVDVSYSVKLFNLPDGIQVKVDDSEFVSAKDGIVEFKDIGRIESGDSTEFYHSIFFIASNSSEEISDLDVKITVTFEQLGNN